MLRKLAKWVYNVPTYEPYCDTWLRGMTGDNEAMFYHFKTKWQRLLKNKGATEGIIYFLCDLDDEWSERLEKYIINNFK